jgi:hypothetical protein
MLGTRSLPKRIAAALKSRISMRDTHDMHEYTVRETSPALANHPVPNQDRYTGGRFGYSTAAAYAQLDAAHSTPQAGY